MVADLLAEPDRREVRPAPSGRSPRSPRAGWGSVGPKLVLAKPLTYMNLSGGPVVALAQFYKVPLEQIIAVHDELDIAVRAAAGQASAAARAATTGCARCRSRWRTKEYARVRFGIGRPPGRQDPADYVLSDFSAAERKELEFLVDRAADVVEAVVIAEGVEWAQNKYHGA